MARGGGEELAGRRRPAYRYGFEVFGDRRGRRTLACPDGWRCGPRGSWDPVPGGESAHPHGRALWDSRHGGAGPHLGWFVGAQHVGVRFPWVWCSLCPVVGRAPSIPSRAVSSSPGRELTGPQRRGGGVEPRQPSLVSGSTACRRAFPLDLAPLSAVVHTERASWQQPQLWGVTTPPGGRGALAATGCVDLAPACLYDLGLWLSWRCAVRTFWVPAQQRQLASLPASVCACLLPPCGAVWGSAGLPAFAGTCIEGLPYCSDYFGCSGLGLPCFGRLFRQRIRRHYACLPCLQPPAVCAYCFLHCSAHWCAFALLAQHGGVHSAALFVARLVCSCLRSWLSPALLRTARGG